MKPSSSHATYIYTYVPSSSHATYIHTYPAAPMLPTYIHTYPAAPMLPTYIHTYPAAPMLHTYIHMYLTGLAGKPLPSLCHYCAIAKNINYIESLWLHSNSHGKVGGGTGEQHLIVRHAKWSQSMPSQTRAVLLCKLFGDMHTSYSFLQPTSTPCGC